MMMIIIRTMVKIMIMIIIMITIMIMIMTKTMMIIIIMIPGGFRPDCDQFREIQHPVVPGVQKKGLSVPRPN